MNEYIDKTQQMPCTNTQQMPCTNTMSGISNSPVRAKRDHEWSQRIQLRLHAQLPAQRGSDAILPGVQLMHWA